MDQEIWQQLLSLESRDITKQWFSRIHGRELNSRRAKEINAAAKQSREYFRNASISNYSVRPLLTFYGVASISRAFLLLLKRDGGEESLTKGHGLNTVEWRQVMSGETSIGLENLLNLEIQTCSGIFSDFVRETENRVSIHVNSSEVDWHINYNIPDLGMILTLGDLFARFPDLAKDFSNISSETKYATVHELTFNFQDGAKARVFKQLFEPFRDLYQSMGYEIETKEEWCVLTCDAKTFEENLPLFVHSYIQRDFGSIPRLYIAAPFQDSVYFSQLCMTYMVSYYLGMLVRYYPTHWISLLQGGKGDALWPTINRAQQIVEETYPELVVEMIRDILKKSDK
jgi:hypothetical protein